MNGLVSVILTCYNQADFLLESLESVRSQTYSNWECIIMDDGSTDNSGEIAQQFAAKDKRFKYVYQTNQGVVSARNNAIRLCKGLYILPLDGDDIISPEYVRKAAEVLDRERDVILVYCKVMRFGEESGILPLNEVTRRNILRAGCCVSSSMFRRESYDKTGGYKEVMKAGWEDWEFFMSLLELGGRVYLIDEPLFHYRILRKSRDRKMDEETKADLRAQMVKLHPQMYYQEYDRLWGEYDSLLHSRIYRVFSFLRGVLRKMIVD